MSLGNNEAAFRALAFENGVGAGGRAMVYVFELALPAVFFF